MIRDPVLIPIPGGLTADLPRFLRVCQNFDLAEVDVLEKTLTQQFDQFRDLPLDGKSVAIAVGSRGIAGQFDVVRILIDLLRSAGAAPFIVPAMGSHGGGTAEGQEAMLSALGYSESTLGIPVRSSMEVVKLGTLSDGMPVWCDREAYNSDYILPVNRVKPHTAFRGKNESGLVKMLVIGVGKHAGAEAMHHTGWDSFSDRIVEATKLFINSGKILFGAGIVENAAKGLRCVELVPPNRLVERDAALLEMARGAMPRLLLRDIDVLIVDALGKDISGAGMDPNVTGRPSSGMPGFARDGRITRIVVSDLTERTGGNATGIGNADVTTLRLAQKVDWSATYVNMITSGMPNGARLPIVAASDRDAIGIALRGCPGVNSRNARIVRIANTLNLQRIWVSEAFADEIAVHPSLEAVHGSFELDFDKAGNIARPLE